MSPTMVDGSFHLELSNYLGTIYMKRRQPIESIASKNQTKDAESVPAEYTQDDDVLTTDRNQSETSSVEHQTLQAKSDEEESTDESLKTFLPSLSIENGQSKTRFNEATSCRPSPERFVQPILAADFTFERQRTRNGPSHTGASVHSRFCR